MLRLLNHVKIEFGASKIVNFPSTVREKATNAPEFLSSTWPTTVPRSSTSLTSESVYLEGAEKVVKVQEAWLAANDIADSASNETNIPKAARGKRIRFHLLTV